MGVCGSNKSTQLIMEALKWHLLPERRSLISSILTRPRKSTVGKILVVGGMDSHKVTFKTSFNIVSIFHMYFLLRVLSVLRVIVQGSTNGPS